MNVVTPYNPEWKQFEEDMHSNDAKTSREASEKFEVVRKEETRKDPKARKWEEERKKSMQKDKGLWLKEQSKREKEEQEKPIKRLLNAGMFECNIKPTPGHVIIQLEEEEKKTESGILIASAINESSNTGTVIAYGEALKSKEYFAKARYQDEKDVTIECPAELGDKVLFKRGAGLDISIKEKKCKLMAFSDLLGVFEDE